MKDIAREAGVHASTVSRALAGRGGVSAGEISRIRAIAERLGFVPDPAIGRLCAYRHGKVNLRSKSAALFAYLTDYDERREGEGRIVAGFKEQCAVLGVATTRWPAALIRNLPVLRKRYHFQGVDGIFIASKSHGENSTHWQDMRVLWMGSDVPHGVPCVHTNMAAAMELAFRKAEACGYRRIGAALFIGPIEERAIHLSGAFLHMQYRAPSSLARIPPLLFDGGESEKDREKTFSTWLTEHQPDVLIGHSSLFHHLATSAGRRIPDELAFISLTATPTNPAIAGVDCQFKGLGVVAANTLHLHYRADQFAHPTEVAIITVQPEWMEGASFPQR